MVILDIEYKNHSGKCEFRSGLGLVEIIRSEKILCSLVISLGNLGGVVMNIKVYGELDREPIV